MGPDGIITTVAGNGSSGAPTPGAAATATPLTPYGIAVAADGTFYVSDAIRVYRVDRNGVLQLFAGTGVGYNGDEIPATTAQLRGPRDVALGPDGSVYIADRLNARIRRVGTDGIISTVAGTGGSGASGDGGPATSAQIGEPWGVAVGGDGTIYIADFANEVIRRVGPDGIIEKVAGVAGEIGYDGDGGPATAAHLSGALGVEVDRDGTVYIPDTYNFAVRRVSTDGVITTVAGTGVGGSTGEGGPAAAARIGYVLRLALDGDGNLLIGDTTSHRVRRVRSPLAETTLIPSTDGMLVYELDAAGRHLDTRNALTGSTPLEFGYDGGLLVTVTDGDGNLTTIERNGNGDPIAIVGPYGQRTTLGLDPNGYLASVTNPAGEQTMFTYTTDGLMRTMTDARENGYSFQYDGEGRLWFDGDPAGGSKTIGRTDIQDGYQVALSTKLGRTTTYEVVNAPTGDQLRANTDPAGLATTIQIGADGETAVLLPDGTNTTTRRTADWRFGMLAPVIGSRTITTPLGRTLSITTVRTPDDPNNFTEQTDDVTVNGRLFQNVLAVGPPATSTTTSAEGRQTISTLDAQGRQAENQRPGSNPILYPIRREYDGNGRLQFLKHGPDPDDADTRITAFTYKSTADNQNGLLDTITDAEARVTSFGYDDAGRVLTQTFQPGTADERTITYEYDDNGNLTSITPPGKLLHGFDYTPVNLEKEYDPPPISMADPKTTYVYNDDRQLEDILRPDGQTIDFGYEPTGGRLQSVTIPSATGSGNEVRTYSYDPTTGNLETLTGPDATLTFGYDGSLLTNEQWNDGTVTSTVTRTYDDDFRVETLQVSSETPIVFGYDGDGLLTKAGALDPITRHPDYGFVTDTTLGAVTDAWTYSSFGELESYTASTSGGPIYDLQITERDKLGRILTKVETIEGATTTYEYVYDPAGRLEDVYENTVQVAHYDYDPNGNRTGGFNAVSGQIISTSHDDQDRLESYETTLGGLTTYSYNENGDLTQKTDANGSTSYTYDALSNLREVNLPDGVTTITHQVDGRNRRIGRIKDDGVTTIVQRFVYKDQLNPVAELDGSGNVLAEFVYGTKPNVPDYMIKGGSTYRIVSDHLGSVRLVINVANETVEQRIDYDEFGNVVTDTNAGFQPFGFAGGFYDSDDSGVPDAGTGLVRFGARDYDPEIGRWTAKDAIGFRGGDGNLYAYVGGNPISFIDPLGLAGCYVGFPGYPITIPGTSTSVPLTHAGVLSYDSQGHTRYYEYGRYDSDFGNVRRQKVPDLTMGPDGQPTADSWAKMQKRLNEIGHGTEAKTSCDADADADKINNFAEQRMYDPNRAPYSWNPFNLNTCTTFASDALGAGR